MKKYLSCECCNFLAVIPHQDDHEHLICPFCYRVKCEHGGKFIEISRTTFLNMADLGPEKSINDVLT